MIAIERPILMQGNMVRATLADIKTQTRRVEKRLQAGRGFVQMLRDGSWEWSPDGGFDCGVLRVECPYGRVGDRLWVREIWSAPKWADANQPRDLSKTVPVFYHADKSRGTLVRWIVANEEIGKTRVSIHMPRWMSRITLEITKIRLQKVQEIGNLDAIAEGIGLIPGYTDKFWKNYLYNGHPRRGVKITDEDHRIVGFRSPIDSYRTLWDSINRKKHPWDANPWVWVIEFKRILT
jgi:hypothetical protein